MSIAVDLFDHTAWVTGGASGIGAAIVSTLVEAGARVVSLDKMHPPGGHLSQPGFAGVAHVALDVADPQQVETGAAALIEAGLAPDVLVNAAGVNRDAAVWNMSDQQWDEVIGVNLTGAFRLVRAVAPAMREHRRGAIVNISSINGIRGKFGQANYSASKGGLIALTKTLARELGPRGIRVNAVAPGMIETAMTQSLPPEILAAARDQTTLGRLGAPVDVANAVLYLVSPLGRHVTGQVLVVDGGQMI